MRRDEVRGEMGEMMRGEERIEERERERESDGQVT